MYKTDSNKTVAHKKEIKYDDRDPVTKLAFSNFFKNNLDVLNSRLAENHILDNFKELPEKITKKWIGDKLDISFEQFRKIINRDKPAKNRDCIIAICALLCLDTHDTNIGLYYNYFEDELDDSKMRDEIIMNILDSHRYKDEKQNKDDVYYNPDVIDEINYALQSAGLNELDIIKHRKSGTYGKSKSTYKIISKSLSYETDFFFYHLNDAKRLLFEGNKCDEQLDKSMRAMFANYSLSSKYRFNCIVKASINLEDNGENFTVSATSDDMDIVKDKKKEIYYTELRKMINAELRKWDIIYNDTKNFGQRVSAKIIDNDLHVFAEKYNYDLPLFNEYYFMDFCNNKYSMSVSHNSRFMKLYLSDEEYYKKYGNTPIKIKQIYYSADSIYGYGSLSMSKYYDVTGNTIEDELGGSLPLQAWHRQYYLMLEEAINELIEKLKKDEEYIVEVSEYSIGEYGIIEYFHAEKDFKCVCKYDQEKIVIVGVDDPTPTFTLSDGQDVELSVQELIDGARLGLTTIEEVGRFKLKHGSLKIKDLL